VLGGGQDRGRFSEVRFQRCDDLAQLAAGGLCVGLREDRAYERGDHLHLHLGDAREQVALVVRRDLCRVCAVAESEVEDAVGTYMDDDVEIITTSPLTIADVLGDMRRIARALDDETAGMRLTRELRGGFDAVAASSGLGHRPRTAVIEWVDPLMGCGNWAPELVEMAGGEPVLANAGAHTPFAEPDDLAAADPEVIVVGPCGYDLDRALKELPLLEGLPGWAKLAAVQTGRVAFLDGSAYLNRPGPRLVDTAETLAAIVGGTPGVGGGTGWCWLPGVG